MNVKRTWAALIFNAPQNPAVHSHVLCSPCQVDVPCRDEMRESGPSEVTKRKNDHFPLSLKRIQFELL